MNSFRYKLIVFTAAALSAVSCGKTPKEVKEVQNQKEPEEEAQAVIPVDTLRLGKKTFSKQIVCNGKLHAQLHSSLNFKTTGVIQAIRVGNGTYVQKGQELAVLNDKDARSELEKTRRQLEKAYIDLQDKLIGQGFMEDTIQVPAKVLQNAKVSSGYTGAQDALDQAKRKVEDCHLVAPFSGRIANMNAKTYDQTGNAFCTLIDDHTFDVEFKVLEAEMNEVFKKQRVKVSPFIDDSKVFWGEVTEINPLIDEHGQIMVRARVQNKGGYLMEGMNVKILLERDIPDCYVVSKDALIVKDGYSVIFCYEEGKAVCKFVDIVMSNIDSHVITGNQKKQTQLSENDVLILTNNINLGDGTPVSINQK